MNKYKDINIQSSFVFFIVDIVQPGKYDSAHNDFYYILDQDKWEIYFRGKNIEELL